MPIFEYKCADCGWITEILERTSRNNDRKCGKCGGRKLKKQFSTFAPVVKQRAGGGKCDGCPEGGACPHG